MGADSSQFYPPSSELHSILNYKYCRVWVRKSDKLEHMEEYRVQIISKQNLEQYKKMFLIRTDHDLFVNTLYFTHGKGDSICSSFQQGSIILERIPHRLCEFNNFPYLEAISIISIALKGYCQLYKIFGLFFVKSTMIGFSNTWKIKLWTHTDLSSPTPENEYCSTPEQMIESIIKCIEKLSIFEHEPLSLFAGRTGRSLSNFQETFNILNEYVMEYNLPLKNTFEDIVQYVREPPRTLFPTPIKEEKKRKNKSLSKFSFRVNRNIPIQPSQQNYFHHSASRQSSPLSLKSYSGMKMMAPKKPIANVEGSPRLFSEYFNGLETPETATKNTEEKVGERRQKRMMEDRRKEGFESENEYWEERRGNKMRSRY